MDPSISDAIVIIEPHQPGSRPASTRERGGTPVLVLLLRQLLDLGIDHVTLSASRAHERMIRPILAGHNGLPVCAMVAGPREGPDSSAAAFYRSRNELDSIPLLVTRGSLLPEPGTWLDKMLAASASNAAVFCGDNPSAPSWSESVYLQNNRVAEHSAGEIDQAHANCFLSGTYALKAEFSDSLFRALSSKEEQERGTMTLERAILDLVDAGDPLETIKPEKTAWLCAETDLSP